MSVKKLDEVEMVKTKLKKQTAFVLSTKNSIELTVIFQI